MNWATLYALLSKKIEESEGIHNSVVETLPAVGEENTLYFVPRTNEEDNNIFDEYLWINNEYEKIGSTEIDLSGYLKEEDVATVALTGDYDDLTNKPDISEFLTEDEADERYMSYDILDPETVTGNPITFDSLEGGKAKSCEIAFGPVQAGSGEPSPENVRPISGWTELNVARYGINLATTIIYKQGYVLSSDGTETVSTNYCITEKVPVNGGSKYILRFKENSGTLTDNSVRVGYYDSDGTFISRITPSNATPALTVPNNAAFVCFSYVNNSSSVNYKWDLMFNEGETPLDYVPYQGTTHTATFDSTIMGGSYDFVSGDGMANLSDKVDLGSLNWAYDSNGQQFYSSALSDMKTTEGWNNLIFYSENYKKGIPLSDGTGGDNIISLGNKRIYIRNTQYTDAETFKTAMTGYYVCYELATPTEITLSAKEIELLKGQNVLWSDANGNITLTAEQLELVKVIANPTGQATGTLEKIQINDDIYEMAEPYTELTLKLDAGLTSLTFTDQSITTDSIFEVYTSVYGVNPTDITISTGSAVLTFESQQSDVNVKIRVWEDKHPLAVSNS